VLESRITSGRVNQTGEAKLTNIPEPLNQRRIQKWQFPGLNANCVPDWIIYDFRLLRQPSNSQVFYVVEQRLLENVLDLGLEVSEANGQSGPQRP